MEFNDIKNIWKKGSVSPDNDKPLTMETMEAFIRKRSRAARFKIKFDIWFSLLIYAVTFVLCVYNFTRYLQSPNLVWILPVMTVIMTLLIIQNIQLIPGIKKIKTTQSSLRDSIAETIHYFKRKYALWQLIFPAGVILLTYNLGFVVDYDPTGYKIYHPGVFIIATVIMYMFIYAMFRFTRTMFVTDLENCLKNLDSVDYEAIEKNIRKHKRVILAVAIGLLILSLGGLLMFLKSAGRI
jgi:hypothetical protein